MDRQPRDTQRSRVYAAEDTAFDLRKCEGLSVADAQAFLDKCCASRVLRRKYPAAHRAPTVTDGRGRRKACYDPWPCHAIRLPRWSRSRWVLLHELAHALTCSSRVAWHGWEFCECYLYLVRVFLGRAAEDTLRQQFKARRVRWRPRRRRQMTEQQREAARSRMLAMHAERQKDAA